MVPEAEHPPDGDADGPVWSARAVAEHLGVSPVTLRSWSRRYGIGPAGHVSGSHRRYRPADVARLESLRRLIDSGMAPSDAARWVQARSDAELIGPTPERPGPALPKPGPAPRDSGPAPGGANVTDESGVVDESGAAARPRVPARAVSGLVAASVRLDNNAIAEVLGSWMADSGVLETWDTLCVPALVRIGQRQARRNDCVDAEHALSWTVGSALRRVPLAPARPGARAALLACADGEWHSLGLDALRAALGERGVRVRMLGACTPVEALLAAVERTRPSAVVVWAQTRATARPAVLARLAQRHAAGPSGPRGAPGLSGEPGGSAGSPGRAGPVLVAAGPGWEGRRLPPAVSRVGSLRAAVVVVMGATFAPA